MRIIAIGPGDGTAPARLTDATAPVPDVAAGEVLVRVGAAGVNPADALQVRGLYPPPAGAPAWPGLEVAGTVVAVAEGVRTPAVGDRVAALLPGGGYAELVSVPAAHTWRVPAGIDDAHAASLPEGLCTAWSSLVDVGRLRPGETVLVHGGAGGVGSLATQMALVLGCRVVTTARGTARVAALQELLAPALAHAAAAGAVDDALTVVDRESEDFVDAAGALGGADVVLDVVGAANLGRNVRALARDGRLVVIGMLKGRRGELDLGELLARRGTVTGTTLRSRSDDEKAAIVEAIGERVWPLVASGVVRPRVHARVPFERAGEAHALLASGEVVGKVVLVP
ncbi:NAD(P)H-quinone oxidoreductase [Flavimobilis rhizosphaerae]|uniref:NAD(P)H-quinone oxidoreductase n=1 Tax=Flavimobilis rhizosphaerae TaxID=2775421 RepID=UPI002E2B2E59|nr:NAD(P)H-quinone oxidoreductase [Flavimobilis rhizosphaerae]